MRRLLTALVLSLVVTGGLATPAQAAPTPVVLPTISGSPEYAATLTADPGRWDPAAASHTYQWLREGQPVPGATGPTYRPGLEDLGRPIAVAVTATDATGATETATSMPTPPIRRARLEARGGQKIVGQARWMRTLLARPGRFGAGPATVSYQWLRGRRAVPGATGRTYAVRPADVGARLRVQLTAAVPGHRPLDVLTEPTPVVRHRIDVRRTVHYRVETRGKVRASVREFRRLAQETFADPRGWRSAGIRFVPIPPGDRARGAFTLVLAQARELPRFSSGCSAMWSCRVGRFVVINQDRWQHASPAWNAAGLPLRGYRHMVVNHETGHWLGLGHASCPGPGRLAPVMQQQSKGLQGCRFNPFPTEREIVRRTPGRVLADLGSRSYSPEVE